MTKRKAVREQSAEWVAGVFIDNAEWQFQYKGFPMLLGKVERTWEQSISHDEDEELSLLFYILEHKDEYLLHWQPELSELVEHAKRVQLRHYNEGHHMDKGVDWIEMKIRLDLDHYNELVDSGVDGELIAHMLLSDLLYEDEQQEPQPRLVIWM